MHNTLIVGICIPFSIITVAIFFMEVFRRFKRQEDYLFTLLCFFSVCWSASKIIVLLTNSVETAKFFMNLTLGFIGFIPPVLLLFVLKFYRVSYKPSISVLIFLFAIPTVNTVMVLTAGQHSLVNTQLEIISLSPVREIVRKWGPWFWAHTVYCYIVSLVLINVIIYRHFRMPKFYRTPSTLMVSGVVLALLGNVITLLQILPLSLDPTPITMSFSLIFFNLAIINNNKSKFARFSYKRVYHYLDEYILLMDGNHHVVDCNKPAFDWFSSQGIPLSSSTLDDILKALLLKGHKESLENEKGADYYFDGETFPMVLNLRVHEMSDAKGEIIGSIAVFTDVTQNRMLIEKLEEKAGMDSLTGLANRMAYEGVKRRFDAEENIPLSVIMCDVNNLKYINDTFGHQYGDYILQIIADVLENMCPNPGFVARIGGDEFIFLLPDTRWDAAVKLTEKIKTALCGCENLPVTITVAMGAATKNNLDENFEDVIALADNCMYSNKKQMKQQTDAD